MTERYPRVFTKVRLGPIEVPNRIFMAANGNNLNTPGPRGTKIPSADFAAYYGERAAGGVGLLIHSQNTDGLGTQPSALFEESVPAFRAVADAVHRHGSKIFGQLWTERAGVPWEPLSPKRPGAAPSATQNYSTFDVNRELSREALHAWVRSAARCVRHLRMAGYDGVQMHAAHGLLGEQVLSPYFNHRTDEYGGSALGRMRLITEILQAVRAEAGSEIAVGLRLACDELLPGSLDQEGARTILGRLVDQGLIDFVDLDIGMAPQQSPILFSPPTVPPLHQVDYVKAVGPAARSKIPVMVAPGRLTALAQAEQLLAEGVADMIGATRGLIAEPELVNNARAGREDRNRTCIACNVCLSGIGRGYSACSINPASYRESRWGVGVTAKAPRISKVVVVGGGPAGLEAARIAAIRGHEVVLFERGDALGGQLRLWGALPERGHLRTTVAWYAARLAELGVSVRLGTEASRATVLAESPLSVIVAAGARYDETGTSGYAIRPIPGWHRSIVRTPERVIAQPPSSGSILVLDEEGLHTGAGLAQLLAERGARVELVTRQLQLVTNLVGTHDHAYIYERLRALGVRITLATYLKEIREGEAIVYDIFTGAEARRPVDLVVLATQRKPELGLASELEGAVAQVYLIGDALAPRGLPEATYEGQRFARLVGEPDAPRTTDDAMLRLRLPDFARPEAIPLA